MEGGEAQTKSEALKPQNAIRCAKALILLSSLKSSSSNGRFTSINSDDLHKEQEVEILKKENGDLKFLLARERVKNKRIKLWGLMEFSLQLMVLLSLFTLLLMLAYGYL